MQRRCEAVVTRKRCCKTSLRLRKAVGGEIINCCKWPAGMRHGDSEKFTQCQPESRWQIL
eukprot:3937337-Rhodomonas_salina.1